MGNKKKKRKEKREEKKREKREKKEKYSWIVPDMKNWNLERTRNYGKAEKSGNGKWKMVKEKENFCFNFSF